jgi:hypothetical protein
MVVGRFFENSLGQASQPKRGGWLILRQNTHTQETQRVAGPKADPGPHQMALKWSAKQQENNTIPPHVYIHGLHWQTDRQTHTHEHDVNETNRHIPRSTASYLLLPSIKAFKCKEETKE